MAVRSSSFRDGHDSSFDVKRQVGAVNGDRGSYSSLTLTDGTTHSNDQMSVNELLGSSAVL